MTQEEIKILTEKIKQGLTLSFQRLVTQTKKEDGEQVISKNGKVTRVKARIFKHAFPDIHWHNKTRKFPSV